MGELKILCDVQNSQKDGTTEKEESEKILKKKEFRPLGVQNQKHREETDMSEEQ